MTEKQIGLVYDLRMKLMRCGYPKIYAVDNETLEAVEAYLIEDLEKKNLDPILLCGKNGLWFKGCELVLEVK